MTSVKISALPEAATIAGGELLPVVQNGETRRATASQIATLTGALLPDNNLSDVPNDALAAENLSVSFVVADLAALKALSSRPEAVIVETGQAKGVWQWESGSSTTADDALVVNPTTGTAGRYKRVYDGHKQAAWWGVSASATGAANITALQAALDSGGEIDLPAETIPLAETQLVPVSNTSLHGTLGATVLSRTGDEVTSYIRPFFNTEDVTDFTLEGVTLDFTVDTSREYGILARATTLGSTSRISVRNCAFFNVPNHIERFCEGVTFENCFFDGGGVSGALCGIATGGAINKTTGAGESTDGLVQNVLIRGSTFRDIRQEGVDFNQDTSDSVIDGNTFIDCNLGGGVTNEVIDIGGVNSMANGCRRITVSNNTIFFSAATDSCGITVKIYSQDITITGNTLINATTASGTAAIFVTDFVRNVTITGNAMRGWRNSIALSASSTDTSENITITGNACDDYFSTGIVVVTGAWVGIIIKGNALESALGTGISLANVTRFVVEGNIVRGAAVDCILVNTTATYGNVTSNNVSGSTIDGIRILGANVQATCNVSDGNGRFGFSVGADHVSLVGNESSNNAQVTADSWAYNISAGSDYALIVGNKAFDTQGGSATQNGFLFGVSDRIVFVGNSIGPVKTSAYSGFGNPTNSIMQSNNSGQTVGVTTVNTDTAFTITPQSSAWVYLLTGTLTADRAVTLSTTNARSGDVIRITRTGGGAFNLNVGTGPLKALATNTWGDFTYSGTAWYLSAYGAL